MLQYHLIKEVMEEALKHLSLVKEFNTVSLKLLCRYIQVTSLSQEAF